jgi:hypothetical protein
MDIESILQEAAEETYDNDDFEKTEISNTNDSAQDILKASADEVAYDDRVEASIVLKREAVDIVSTIHSSEPPKESRPEGSGRPPRSTSHREEYRNENEKNIVAENSDEDEVARTKFKKNSNDDDDEDDDDDDIEYGDFDADMDTELLIASYRGEIRYNDMKYDIFCKLGILRMY